jgi:hypothetical protein
MLNKNLKAGLLSPRDYTRYMQNLMDGTNQAFGLFDDYNQEYSRKMKMVEDGTLSQVDLEIMANTESFANFQNHRLVINPDDSKVASARMIEGPDGTLVPDTNPNHLALVSVLRDRIRQTVPKFNVMGVSQQRAEALGKDERTIIESMGTAYKAGIFKEVSDIRQRERYGDKTDAEYAKELGIKEEDFKSISLFYESQDKWAKSQVSSDVNSMAGASTLIDFITSKGGTQYTTTFDPKGVFNEDGSRDETVILLENKNGRVVSNLTDIQQANAEQALKDQSESMIDTKVTTKTVFTEKAPPVVSRGGVGGPKGPKGKDTDLDFAGYLKDLWEGTPGQIKAAEQRIQGYNPDIVKIERDDKGVYITYADEEGKPTVVQPFEYAGLTEADWISGISSFVAPTTLSKDYVSKALKWSGYNGPNKLQTYNRTITQKGLPVQKERENLTRNTFYSKKTEDVITEIMDEVDKYDGYKIIDYGTYIDNDIDIQRMSDKTVKTFNVNQNNLAKAQNEVDKLYKFIKGGSMKKFTKNK